MEFVHGDIRLQVPDEWVDASQIGFMSPPDPGLADEFAKQAAAAGAPIAREIPSDPKSRANFTFTTRPWFLEMPPEEFLERELPAMMAQVPQGKVGEFGWTELGFGKVAMQELEMSMEGMGLKQLHLMGVCGDRILHFVGTAGLGDYDDYRDLFLETAKTISIG